MEFRDYLEQEMRQRGLSLREFAKHTGVSFAQLQKLISGAHKMPHIATLDHLSEALKIPFPRLLEMLGYELRLTPEGQVAERIAGLVQQMPQLESVAHRLAQLPAAERDALLSKLEQDIAGRSGQSPASSADDP